MSADSVWLNTTASNIANANSVTSSADETYRARYPVFAAQLAQSMADQSTGSTASNPDAAMTVQIAGIVESDKPLRAEYHPDHPMANEEGYIFMPNVNVMEEMTNMILASRSYQTNVELAQAGKQMLMRTLQLGR